MESVVKQLSMNSAAAEFGLWGSALLCSDAELLVCGAGRAPSGLTVTFHCSLKEPAFKLNISAAKQLDAPVV